MENTRTTRPAKIRMGAMVMRVVLYTSSGLNTLGSSLLPPDINKNPIIISAAPPSIHSKLVLSNKGKRLEGTSFDTGVGFLDFIEIFLKDKVRVFLVHSSWLMVHRNRSKI